jgi:hypothetical protein
MKCSNPDCSRGIGLVSHRASWFDKQLCCSRQCRDTLMSHVPRSRPSRYQPPAASYFEWLFSQPSGRSRLWPGQPSVRVTGSFG